MWSATLEKLDACKAIAEAEQKKREFEKEKPWNRRSNNESNT